MRLLAGLGNPGSNYAMNRHNVGFLAIDRLADRHGFSPWKKKGPSLISDGRIGSEKIILVKPQSFINKSGLPIAEIARFHKIDANDIFVFHDELDLAAGKLRVKTGGGHGGHNGLRDINQKLGTNRYARVRVGVGRPPQGYDTANYVLGRFSSEENASLDDLVGRAADATRAVVAGGVASAMNTFNAR